jgi:hypothetical protein
VDEGKVKNQYEVLICDPDEHKYEGKFMGLFYTAISRATTLGDDTGLNSAIYFTGPQFKEERFRNLGKQKGSVDDFIPIQKRSKWVDYLKKRTHPIKELNQEMIETLHWSTIYRMDQDDLYKRITQYILANSTRRSATFGNGPY